MSVFCPRCERPCQTRELMGVEDPDVYDGVLYWIHSVCDTAIQRWQASSWRTEEGRRQVEAHNRTTRS